MVWHIVAPRFNSIAERRAASKTSFARPVLAKLINLQGRKDCGDAPCDCVMSLAFYGFWRDPSVSTDDDMLAKWALVITGEAR